MLLRRVGFRGGLKLEEEHRRFSSVRLPLSHRQFANSTGDVFLLIVS